MHGGGGFFFFFNDTATTEIYTLSLPRRSSDLSGGAVRLCQGDHCLPPQREHGTREPRAQRFHGGASTQHAERRLGLHGDVYVRIVDSGRGQPREGAVAQRGEGPQRVDTELWVAVGDERLEPRGDRLRVESGAVGECA